MSYITERRQEERDRRRAEIVDAAEALYAEVGWDAVTMDQVARRARLSRALVYVYFRDKSDLHLALVERALDTLRERFEAARAGKDRGIDVTCEVTPHHFVLTDDALEGYDTNVKMNPPLDNAQFTFKVPEGADVIQE